MVEAGIYYVLSTAMIYLAFVLVINEHLNWKKHCAIFMYIFILSVLTALAGQILVYAAIGGGLVLIYFFTEQKLFSVCCAIAGYICVVCLSNIVTVLLNICFSMSLADISQNYGLLYNIVFLGLEILCLLLVRKVLREKVLPLYRRISGSMMQMILLSLIALLLIIMTNIVFAEYSGYTSSAILINSALFVVYTLMTLLLIMRSVRALRREEAAQNALKQYDSFMDYTRHIEQINREMRRFRHDYINIFTTLTGYIEESDSQQLKEYFRENIMPFSDSFVEMNIDFKLTELGNIHIMELKSLLAAKIFSAGANKVKVNLEVIEPVEEIHMDMVELSRVMGIFLDNAIEAVLSMESSEIDISIFKVDDMVAICVGNRIVEEQISLATIKRNGFTTKAGHAGIGLYSVEQTLAKYRNAILNTSVKEQYFLQRLDIYA